MRLADPASPALLALLFAIPSLGAAPSQHAVPLPFAGRADANEDAQTRAIAAALGAKEAFVEFVRTPELAAGERRDPQPNDSAKLFALVMRRDAPLVRVELGAFAPIESARQDWLAAIDRERGDLTEGSERESGTALRKLVFDRVLAALGPVERVDVYLGEALGFLPFEALPLEAGVVGDRFLVVHELSRARLTTPRARSFGTPSLLALGGIDFDAELKGEGRRRGASPTPSANAADARPAPSFEALPATAGEVEALGRLFEDVFDRAALVLKGPQADKDTLRANLPRARFVHLATHGSLIEGRRHFGGDERGRAERFPRFPPAPRDDESGARPSCGLALAGANHADEREHRNGLLSADELARIGLAGCELFVCSACDARAHSRRAAFDLRALQTAAHAAGVHTVIASCWRVRDRAARELLLDFYRRIWIEEQPKAAALWYAKCTLRERGAPVRDWAAWVLTGDPD